MKTEEWLKMFTWYFIHLLKNKWLFIPHWINGVGCRGPLGAIFLLRVSWQPNHFHLNPCFYILVSQKLPWIDLWRQVDMIGRLIYTSLDFWTAGLLYEANYVFIKILHKDNMDKLPKAKTAICYTHTALILHEFLCSEMAEMMQKWWKDGAWNSITLTFGFHR